MFLVHEGAPRPKHASGRAAFCRTQDHASALVSRQIYDARPCGSRFLEVDPVEGGSCNDYEYTCGDSINNYDLDGERCWTGVAWKEKIRYKDKNGKWKTKTKEHCNSIAKGVKRNARGAVSGARKAVRATARTVQKYGISCMAGTVVMSKFAFSSGMFITPYGTAGALAVGCVGGAAMSYGIGKFA